jgi:cytoskeletal protein RodZ
MVESVGKKLHQARLQRGLTIDEAAHATKLRPDKIAALEGDDYSRFANNVYARGFLQIYGRFLKVNVDDFARTLDNANPISISDYQYLSNAPAAKQETMPSQRDERRPPSLAPLIVFVVVVALIALAGSWVYRNYERIQGQAPDKSTKSATIAMPAPSSDTAFIADSSTPKPMSPALATPSVVPSTPFPLPTTGTPAPKPPEQDFVTPSPVTSSDPAARSGGINEVLVAAVKKTWVTVRRDDPKGPPIFDDYVYPHANPLKLKGTRFFIEARDPAAVQITKNGLPFAYQPTGVPVQ